MIKLQPFELKTCKLLTSWIDSAETLMQFAGPEFTYPLTEQQIKSSLDDVNRHAFSVVDDNASKIIGHAELYFTGESIYLARIIVGDEHLRNKGLGKMIVRHLLDFAFKKFDVQFVQLNVFDWNLSAISCYQKVGFTINPDKKFEREINGEVWTALNLQLTRTAWSQMGMAE